MKILLATKNPAKVKRYYSKLKPYGIDLISIKDIKEDIEVDESGSTALENAYIKAKAYYELTKIPSIGLDDNLFIEGIPDDLQPGTHVRRVNGKELNDEEMIEYYSNLAKQYGGKLKAKWIYGMVLYDGKNAYEHTWSKGGFFFSEKACDKRNVGYPLDSITIWPKYNKYWLELSEEERNDINKQFFNDGVEDFIVKCINDK